MTITPQQFSDRLRDLHGLVSGDLAKSALEKPATGLFKEIRKRIFEQGRNSNNGNIGQYSVKPLYASKEMFAKPSAFKPQGLRGEVGDKLVPTFQLRRGTIKPTKRNIKNFSVVKSNDKPRKTMYLPQGYKELRDIQGLRTDIVNIDYRGELKKSFIIAKEEQAFLIGFDSKPESDKRFALERQFGPLFYATEPEKQRYLQATAFNLARLTVGALEGLTITPTFE